MHPTARLMETEVGGFLQLPKIGNNRMIHFPRVIMITGCTLLQKQCLEVVLKSHISKTFYGINYQSKYIQCYIINGNILLMTINVLNYPRFEGD